MTQAEPDHMSALRADFQRQAGRSMSMPIAGALVWGFAAVTALALPARTETLVLLFATGAIFPLALVIARVLGEALLSNVSPLARLMGASVLMVNLLWALHLTLFARYPEAVPLSLGIGLGLHWVVFSWIIGHPMGLIHAVARTVLATALWWLLPAEPVTAVATGVVVAYAYSIVILARRPVVLLGV